MKCDTIEVENVRADRVKDALDKWLRKHPDADIKFFSEVATHVNIKRPYGIITILYE
jgi:hypothetical protein